MQQGMYDDLVVEQLIRDDVRRSGNDQLPRAGDSTGPSAQRMNLEPCSCRFDSSRHRSRGGRVTGGDVVSDRGEMRQRKWRPLDLLAIGSLDRPWRGKLMVSAPAIQPCRDFVVMYCRRARADLFHALLDFADLPGIHL